MKLTDRMQGVADLVTPGLVLADIGTDHSYLPIYLVKNGIVPQAIAMDVNKGPLKKAQENIEAEGLSDRITTRLSDGLTKLEDGEAKSIIIAGMGGRLVLNILFASKHQWRFVEEFILQPQSELEFFRRQMKEWGFVCVDENMIFDDGKYYPMGRYVYRGTDVQEAVFLSDEDMSQTQTGTQDRVYFKYGEQLLQKGNATLQEYLMKEESHLKHLLQMVSESTAEEAKSRRLEEISLKLEDNQYALELLQRRK